MLLVRETQQIEQSDSFAQMKQRMSEWAPQDCAAKILVFQQIV